LSSKTTETKTDNRTKLSKKAILSELWHRGELSWLLYDHQLPIYKALRTAITSRKLKYVLNCARRFGKTTILVLIALEEALRLKHRHIRFASCTGKEVRNAVLPIMQILLETCPESIKPKWNSIDGSFKFSNGSELHIAGVNNCHEDDLRGANSHLNIVDEAGMIDNLKYLIQSILIPQTLTTNAITLIASTPSVTQDHDYKLYYDEAQASENLSEFDVYDNKSLTPEIINKIMEDNGGANSTTWQREYLCSWVVDEELDIIKEWKDEYIGEVERDEFYDFYHKYTCMDLGVKDLTALLYGYYDFKNARLVIQAEGIINGRDMTTAIVADMVQVQEKELWSKQKPYKRIADSNNPLMLQDLTTTHGVHFSPTNKDSLDAMINKVRLFVGAGRLVVHPDCTHLIACLKYAIWKNKPGGAREFARSATYGHYDALASLVYLIRNLDEQSNPIPVTYNMDANNYHINNDFGKKDQLQSIEALKNIYGRK